MYGLNLLKNQNILGNVDFEEELEDCSSKIIKKIYSKYNTGNNENIISNR